AGMVRGGAGRATSTCQDTTTNVSSVRSLASGITIPAAIPLRRYSMTAWLIRSPGTSVGIPGGYGVTCSAAIRPAAFSAGMASRDPKKASRGDKTDSSSSSPGSGSSTNEGGGKDEATEVNLDRASSSRHVDWA